MGGLGGLGGMGGQDMDVMAFSSSLGDDLQDDTDDLLSFTTDQDLMTSGGPLGGGMAGERDGGRTWLLGGGGSVEDSFLDMWPLPLVDRSNEDQYKVIFGLLGGLPHVIEHYLNTYVFPATCKHQGVKLSACGQELGGNLIFRQRLGFSGTPSDLLPIELGR